MTKLALIVAMAENRVIGRDNQLPWHLPNDLAYFKKVTMGKPIIMGRKTFESIGRPLPGRENIVITRQSDWARDDVTVCNSLEDAIAHASSLAAVQNLTEIMVIGGSEIYKQALNRADRLYLTRVHGSVEGDALFPALNEAHWIEQSSERHDASGSNPYDYSFIVLDRT